MLHCTINELIVVHTTLTYTCGGTVAPYEGLSAGWQVDGLTGRCRVRTFVPLYPCTTPPPPFPTLHPAVVSIPFLLQEGPVFPILGSQVPLSRSLSPSLTARTAGCPK